MTAVQAALSLALLFLDPHASILAPYSPSGQSVSSSTPLAVTR